MSLVVLRSAPDEVRAFHNSCLHRGTRLRSQPGRIGELRCPFHGFTWNLDGSFAGMPCPWDFPQVDTASFCLPEARVGRWGGFVFVNVAGGVGGADGDGRAGRAGSDTDGGSLEDYLEILPEHFASWDLGDRYLSAHVVRVVPCNWKVALEAFIESYHTVAVHPQLLKTSGDTQTQYDVYEGVRHVNRMITPVGIASEHVEGPVEEQDILDAMFLTKDDAAVVPEGASARLVLADRTRADLALRTGRDYSSITDCEALDAIEYFVFPNFVPWAGYTTPLVYRFRPHGDDPRAAVMDVMLLEPVPASGVRPPAAPTRHLEPGARWADAPELGYLGRILDQDTATLARVQHGPGVRAGPRRDPGALPGVPHPSFPRHARRVPRPMSVSSPGGSVGAAASGASARSGASDASAGSDASGASAGSGVSDASAGSVASESSESSESVWEADDTEPVLDTTVGSILRDAARRSPDTTALVAGRPIPHRVGAGLTPSSWRTPSGPRQRWRRASSRANASPWWPRASPSRSSSPTRPHWPAWCSCP